MAITSHAPGGLKTLNGFKKARTTPACSVKTQLLAPPQTTSKHLFHSIPLHSTPFLCMDSISKFDRCHHRLKRSFQVLLSVSVLSLFFLSRSASLAPSTHPKSLKPFLSSFISNHLSFVVNRSLMFLLCNVILVFVTGGFGCFGVSPNAIDDIHGGYLVRWAAHHQSTAPVEYEEAIVDSVVLVDNCVSDIEEEGPEEEDEEEADGAANQDNHHFPQHHLYQPRRRRPNDHHHPYDQRQRGCQHHLKQQQHYYHPQLRQRQEEEEENENVKYKQQQQEQDERGGLVITEESDERFDDFIKQVKEGMRREAKQSLQTA